ncbi:MAG: hypothetical protein HKN47_05570 [Pirellulaceae bacterium]|nr:hypothetical protein [Pirellulaceae bacterium]
MSSDSDSTFSSTPVMSAEAGFDGSDAQAPIRISGFLCLLLGLLSVITFMAPGLLVLPFAAILLGAFALRRYDPPKPVGITPAYLGVLLAVGFGAFGLGIPLMKQKMVGEQAEYLARQYVELVARGEDYYAIELRKEFNNRFIRSMPLEEHYKDNENATKTLEEFREDGIYEVLRRIGPDANWELDRAVRCYYRYGREHADVVLVNHDKSKPVLVRVILQCIEHPDTGDLEWHVDTCMQYRERLVAESIL